MPPDAATDTAPDNVLDTADTNPTPTTEAAPQLPVPAPPDSVPTPLKPRHRLRRRVRHERPRLVACANCGHPTAETHRYCPACGQEAKHPDASLIEILADAWDEFVKIDSKLLRTILPLLFRPGFLTCEYMAGRRIRYITPFRLYLTISFLFFLAVTYRSTNALTAALGADLLGQHLPEFADTINRRFGDKDDKTLPHLGVTVKPKAPSHPPRLHIGLDGDGVPLPESVAAYDKAQAALPVARRDGTVRQFFLRRAIGVRSRSPMDILSDFFNAASKSMILLLPLYAFLLKVLYWRRGRSYVEHFVFALHIHSALFLVASLYLLLPLPHEGEILTLALFIYGFIALHTVYQQSFGKTVLKAILLFLNYSTVFLIALILTACFSIVV